MSCSDIRTKKLIAHSINSKYMEAKKGCFDNVKSKNIESEILKVNNIDVGEVLQSLSIAQTTSVDSPTCNPSSILGEFTPQYLETYGINEDVFNMMLEKAYEVVFGQNGLEQRLAAGRQRLGLPFEGIRLLGSMSFAPWNPTYPNNPNLSNIIDFQTKLSWSLKCANTAGYLNGTNPNPAVVSVYIQYGYIDKKTQQCKCELINVGNIQIDPTIDYRETDDPYNSESWGEIFDGTQVLDTNLVYLIYENMPTAMNTGGVQLLFFAENQVQLLQLNTCNVEEQRVNSAVTTCQDNCTTSVEGNVSVDVNVV